MSLIDNLEELAEDDFISTTISQREKIIYKIISVNEKEIKVEDVQVFKYSWSTGNYYKSYQENNRYIILKKIKKTKKKKLKHKVVTYNNDLVIFKLTEKERREVVRKKILENLK